MADLRLSMALSHYDRHIPFFDGSVQVEGVSLQVLEVGQSSPLKHGQDRHERMLQKGEFDICELSLSNYLVAKSRGIGVELHRDIARLNGRIVGVPYAEALDVSRLLLA